LHTRRLLRQRRNYLSSLLKETKIKIENPQINIQQDTSATKEQQLFHRLNEYMLQTNAYVNSINCSDLARHLNTNEKYIYQAIKDCIKMSFSEYITSLRLELAKKFLSDPDNTSTIESIVEDCGFKSRSTLHKLFIQQYGVSPGKWRTNNQKQ
jgi:AraC-like DNA-binding protein